MSDLFVISHLVAQVHATDGTQHVSQNHACCYSCGGAMVGKCETWGYRSRVLQGRATK